MNQDFEAAKKLFSIAVSDMQTGAWDSAYEYLTKALSLAPGRISILNNLASVYIKRGQFDEALKTSRLSLEQEKNAAAMLNIGIVKFKTKGSEAAIPDLTEALRLDSKLEAAWLILGEVYHELGVFEKALECEDECLKINPQNSSALLNKANTLKNMGQLDDAYFFIEMAIHSKPHYDEALWNKSLICFFTQKYQEGWDLSDYRWKHSGCNTPYLKTTRPKWEGLGSEGSRIFVWAEQGVGDTILYSAMLKDLERLDRSFLVSTDERLRPIFERSFPAMRFVDRLKTIPEDQYDRHIPIGDLGKYFRDQLEKFGPTRPGYLVTDPLKDDKWKHVLHKTKSIKIGLSWKSTNKSFGRHKSIDLGALESLLSIPGIEFINLQYESSIEEINSLPPEIQKKIISLDGLDARNDLDNLLSVMQACDAIVTVSNTTAHLSGAIGKKTLVMLPYSQGKIWYWQNHPTLPGSLWYQSVQLSNQSQHGRWENVIDEIKIELEKIQKNKNI